MQNVLDNRPPAAIAGEGSLPEGMLAAFACCTNTTRNHSKSFYLASALLPEGKREAIRALYAYCRVTDDIVDVSSSDQRAVRLRHWRAQARLPWQAQTDPVLLAWSWVRDRYRVPQRYADELIDGCERDLYVRRYETWEDLRQYCYLVASTVGLLSMHIIGSADRSAQMLEDATPDAIDLGVALQLTNILRDVGEDHQRGRIYLPAEDLHRFGVTEDDIAEGRNDERFRALMRFEMDRADALYNKSWRAIKLLAGDGRFAIGAASLLYRGILGQIHANNYDVFSRRAHLTARQKLTRLPGIYMRVRAL
jgi:15-cis-phytoene synthase